MDGLDNVLDAQRLELAHNVSLKKFLTRAKLVFQFCKIWHEHTDTKIIFRSKNSIMIENTIWGKL